YAVRIELPHRDGPGDSQLEYGTPIPQMIGGLVWLVRGFVYLLFRLCVDVPRAALRARPSDAWTIEAVSWAPSKRTYTWKTTREHLGQSLAQIEGGLARGESPRPGNAQFVRSD